MTPQNIDQILSEWESVANSATSGKWELERCHALGETWFRLKSGNQYLMEMKGDMADAIVSDLDAEFIALSREAVPRLIQALKKCREQRDYVADYPVSHEDLLDMEEVLSKLLQGGE